MTHSAIRGLLQPDADERAELADSMMGFAERAYPIFRSLTGDGVRATLELMRETVPFLEIHEVPSGEPVLDWTVPKEWNVREAWVEGPDGRRVVDVAEHTLHLLGYSVPFDGTVSRAELDEHLYSLPDRPELIPYRTSYYAERWGFCLADSVRRGLPDGEYRVRIDTTLDDGHLTYGEAVLPGRSEQEILVSTHCCHPSLANDNLSGLAVVAAMASRLSQLEPEERRYTVRFVFVPGTIGAIVWLARNREGIGRVRHGLVASNLGDAGGFHYKRSRGGTLARGDGAGGAWPVDLAVERAAQSLGFELDVSDFVPFGYDERQYGSPGFDLPVGSLCRSPWGRYPEYHTSADDLSILDGERLVDSLRLFLGVCAELEERPCLLNLQPYAEPQLGRRGLYGSLGGDERGRERELAMLWVLNLADGRRSVEEIARRSGLEAEVFDAVVAALLEAELVAWV